MKKEEDYSKAELVFFYSNIAGKTKKSEKNIQDKRGTKTENKIKLRYYKVWNIE